MKSACCIMDKRARRDTNRFGESKKGNLQGKKEGKIGR